MKWIILAAAMGLSVKAGDWVLPKDEPSLKPGAQVQMVTAQCLICHSADYISTQPPLKRATWEAIVIKMREKYGAPLPANQVQAVVDYLAENYASK